MLKSDITSASDSPSNHSETNPHETTLNLSECGSYSKNGMCEITIEEYMQLLVPMLNRKFNLALSIINSLLSQYPKSSFLLDYQHTLQNKVSQDNNCTQSDPDTDTGSETADEESSSSTCSSED